MNERKIMGYKSSNSLRKFLLRITNSLVNNKHIEGMVWLRKACVFQEAVGEAIQSTMNMTWYWNSCDWTEGISVT